jgi:hypothetical protein
MSDPARRDRKTCLVPSLVLNVKVKHVEQVADGRHVARHVARHVSVGALNRIGQVIAAAIAERGVEHPVPFHKFHEGGMLIVDVADMTAGSVCVPSASNMTEASMRRVIFAKILL